MPSILMWSVGTTLELNSFVIIRSRTISWFSFFSVWTIIFYFNLLVSFTLEVFRWHFYFCKQHVFQSASIICTKGFYLTLDDLILLQILQLLMCFNLGLPIDILSIWHFSLSLHFHLFKILISYFLIFLRSPLVTFYFVLSFCFSYLSMMCLDFLFHFFLFVMVGFC